MMLGPITAYAVSREQEHRGGNAQVNIELNSAARLVSLLSHPWRLSTKP